MMLILGEINQPTTVLFNVRSMNVKAFSAIRLIFGRSQSEPATGWGHYSILHPQYIPEYYAETAFGRSLAS